MINWGLSNIWQALNSLQLVRTWGVCVKIKSNRFEEGGKW